MATLFFDPMYTRFFGLRQEPFSLAPDPRYLFMSKRHREALAHLLYGVGGGGGFVLLSGEIGAGKTTVCRCFLEQVPKRCNVAYIFNPKLTVIELLRTICDEFHVPYREPRGGPATVKTYVDPLNEFLLKTHGVGQNNVLIIDEAQMLSVDVLEQLRLLTNLETSERKLLQIVLIGQPELRTLLARPELEQLAQRVIARFHLKALSESETMQYVRHRLSVAGLTRTIPFDRKALRRVHQIARGVPRRINLICDRAMLGAYATGRHTVDTRIVEKAAHEVFGRSEPAGPDRARVGRPAGTGLVLATGAALLALLAFAGYGGWRHLHPADEASTRNASASPPASSSAAASGSAGVGSTRLAGAASAASGAGPIASTRSSASSMPSAAVTAAKPSLSAMPVTLAATGAAPASSVSPPVSPPVSASVPSAESVAVRVAAAAPPPAPAPAVQDAAARIKAVAGDERSGMRELISLWGLAAAADDPCAAAARQQVRCSKFKATLPLLRNLGRPGLLQLQEEAGRPAWVLVTGLGAKTATLRRDGRSETVPLTALAQTWQGQFATLWRLPAGYTTSLGDGASGPIVDQLAAQLAALDGEPAPAGRQQLDAALKSRLARFQSAHGLSAVGKAGPTTFMQLNRATGVDEPRLAVADAAAP